MSVEHRVLELFHRAGLLRALRRRAARRGRFVLMFHGISRRRRADLPRTSQPFLEASDLARILTWLGERYRLLTTDEFVEASTAGILLTFDDGYANNHDQALPILVEHGAPAIFFVTTQHVVDPGDWLPSIVHQVDALRDEGIRIDEETARDLYDGMSVDQLTHCASTGGIEIGSHSVSHPFLTRLSPADLERELGESKRQLEAWTDREARFFAYPTGDYDNRVARAVEAAGYRAAFAERSRREAHERRFELPRIGLYRSEPWYLEAKLSGLDQRALPLARGEGALP